MNLAAGARTRWAGILSGVWMLIILLAFSLLIGMVAQSTLAALLIVAGIGSIRPSQIRLILRTGAVSRVGLIATFVATLLLPVAVAVAVGVLLSLVMQLNRDAIYLKVVRLVPADGRWRETAVPKTLAPQQLVAIDRPASSDAPSAGRRPDPDLPGYRRGGRVHGRRDRGRQGVDRHRAATAVGRPFAQHTIGLALGTIGPWP